MRISVYHKRGQLVQKIDTKVLTRDLREQFDLNTLNIQISICFKHQAPHKLGQRSLLMQAHEEKNLSVYAYQDKT